MTCKLIVPAGIGDLTSQSLDEEAMKPPMAGIAMFPAYSMGDYSGNFAPYASDIITAPVPSVAHGGTSERRRSDIASSSSRTSRGSTIAFT